MKCRRPVQETDGERYFRHRVRYLPIQIENTYRKLAMLENEAARYGMKDLIRRRGE